MKPSSKPWKPVYHAPDPKLWRYYNVANEAELWDLLLNVCELTFSCGDADYSLSHASLSASGTGTGWRVSNYRTGQVVVECTSNRALFDAVFVPQEVSFYKAFRLKLIRFFEDMDFGVDKKYGWKYEPDTGEK